MIGIQLNTKAIQEALRAVTKLAGIQQAARKRLLREVGDVCSKCDDAYSAMLKRLSPVKKVYRAPKQLATELHKLKADTALRARFKPEGLCSEIDGLLDDMSSALSSLPYSVHFLAIGELKSALRSMGNYDAALYHQYDSFMNELESVAFGIENGDAKARASLGAFARDKIADLENDLKKSVSAMRSAKERVRKNM